MSEISAGIPRLTAAATNSQVVWEVDNLVGYTLFDFDWFISVLIAEGLAERRRKRRS